MEVKGKKRKQETENKMRKCKRLQERENDIDAYVQTDIKIENRNRESMSESGDE